MHIVLKPGEVVKIIFEDHGSEITVGHTGEELFIQSDTADSDGRKGKLYSERFINDMCEFNIQQLDEEEVPATCN